MGLWEGQSAYQYQIRETPYLYTFVCIHAPGGVAYRYIVALTSVLLWYMYMGQSTFLCGIYMYRKVCAAQIHLFISQ